MGTCLAADKSGQRYAGSWRQAGFFDGGGKDWELTVKGRKNKTAGSRPVKLMGNATLKSCD
jgi:hypothetical protein